MLTFLACRTSFLLVLVLLSQCVLLHSWNSPHRHEKEYITNDRTKNVKNPGGMGVKGPQSLPQSQEVACNWTVFLHATHNQKEQKRCEVPTNVGKYPHSHNYQ